MTLTATAPRSQAHQRARLEAVVARAHEPVSGASLAVFRMLFGAVAVFGALRFVAKGWVDVLYIDPAHHLTYAGFDWVQPLPEPFMYLHMFWLAALGISIAVGYRFRLSMLLYAVSFTYIELVDAALYLNHYWFVSIASFVLAFVPLNAMWSMDARAGRARSALVPAWAIWTVRAQLAVVYLFAGIAKLQYDWLVRAQPMTMWLADRTDLPLVGVWLDDQWVAYMASWAGAAFDCTIVFWLLWKRSRPFAYMAVIAFHAATGLLFQIGIFPWLMIAGTLVFFSPRWPLKWAPSSTPSVILDRREGIHRVAHQAMDPLSRLTPRSRMTEDPADAPQSRMTVVVLLGLVALIQIAIPLRHYAYPGDVRWTEEGYYGSWRVMLTEKGGDLSFRVTDPQTNEQWTVAPTSVLTDWQARVAATRPDLLLATAHIIADVFEKQGHDDVEVRADSYVSFNARPVQRMVDPDVDLAAVKRGPGHKNFILPLVTS